MDIWKTCAQYSGNGARYAACPDARGLHCCLQIERFFCFLKHLCSFRALSCERVWVYLDGFEEVQVVQEELLSVVQPSGRGLTDHFLYVHRHLSVRNHHKVLQAPSTAPAGTHVPQVDPKPPQEHLRRTGRNRHVQSLLKSVHHVVRVDLLALHTCRVSSPSPGWCRRLWSAEHHAQRMKRYSAGSQTPSPRPAGNV